MPGTANVPTSATRPTELLAEQGEQKEMVRRAIDSRGAVALPRAAVSRCVVGLRNGFMGAVAGFCVLGGFLLSGCASTAARTVALQGDLAQLQSEVGRAEPVAAGRPRFAAESPSCSPPPTSTRRASPTSSRPS